MDKFASFEEVSSIISPYKKMDLASIDWNRVVYTASREFILPAIPVALSDRGALESLPDNVKKYFLYILSLNRKRNQALLRQALEVVKELNGIGIKPLLLKGMAHLFSGLYSDIGARVIGDIDILIPEEKRAEIVSLFIKKGYEFFPELSFSYERHHHMAPLFHRKKVARVEFHRWPLKRDYRNIISSKMLWEGALTMEKSGATFLVPDITHSIIISLAHEALMNRNYVFLRVPLKGLYDLFLLTNSHEKEILQSYSIFKKGPYRDVFESYMYMMHMLFGRNLPEGLRVSYSSKMYIKLVKCSNQTYLLRRGLMCVFLLLRAMVDREIRGVILSHIEKRALKYLKKNIFNRKKRRE